MIGPALSLGATLIAIGTLFVVIVVILLAARVATVVLTATGLPFEIARFQARSALTGVGFTTGESESITTHPLRRRVVLTLMLVGNAGFVTIIASVMLSFVSSGGTRQILIRIGIMIGGLIVLAVVAHSDSFERRLTSLVARAVDRFSDLDLRDFHHLLQLSRDYAVTEMQVQPGDWLAGRTLVDLELPDEGVLVLAITKPNGEFVGAPRGDTSIDAYDTVVLYGRSSVLTDLDARPATPQGDEAHRDAVAKQADIMAEPVDEDP